MVDTVTTTSTETSAAAAVAPAVVAVVPPSAPHVVSVSADFLANADRRKTWAIMFLAGGGLMMTIYAAFVLYIVRTAPAHYAYWLGMFAMANIFTIFTGLLGMFVKRTLNVSKNGILVEDKINGSQDQQG